MTRFEPSVERRSAILANMDWRLPDIDRKTTQNLTSNLEIGHVGIGCVQSDESLRNAHDASRAEGGSSMVSGFSA